MQKESVIDAAETNRPLASMLANDAVNERLRL